MGMVLGVPETRLRIKEISLKMRGIIVGMWGMQGTRLGIWGMGEGMQGIRLEMRENLGKIRVHEWK